MPVPYFRTSRRAFRLQGELTGIHGDIAPAQNLMAAS